MWSNNYLPFTTRKLKRKIALFFDVESHNLAKIKIKSTTLKREKKTTLNNHM